MQLNAAALEGVVDLAVTRWTRLARHVLHYDANLVKPLLPCHAGCLHDYSSNNDMRLPSDSRSFMRPDELRTSESQRSH